MFFQFDYSLVTLSVLVAVAASYVAIDMTGRISAATGRVEMGWRFGGAFAMGMGVWAMHFIGMLALELPFAVSFDLRVTALSMLAAIVASYFAFRLVSLAAMTWYDMLFAGLMMGLGIAVMNYVGLRATQLTPDIKYDLLLFIASVLYAVLASLAALWLAFQFRDGDRRNRLTVKLGASVVMGLAVAGMYYTAIAAARIPADAVSLASGLFAVSRGGLALNVTIIVMAILTIALMVSVFDARLASRTGRLLVSLEKAHEDLKRKAEERRQTMDALARSNLELEQFAYVASHDLQAPLRNIAGFAQLLQRQYENRLDARADEFINEIIVGTKSMETLIFALLDLSRVSGADKDFQPTPIGTVVEEACSRLRSVIEERGARVVVGDLPTLQCDRPLMLQMFQNLIANAIKFQPGPAPLVEISARCNKAVWEISVRDEGIGIDAQHQSRIFRIFQRLHGESEYEGTGIGLSICAKIAQIHGGELRVESSLGVGSRFYFYLPQRRQDDHLG
ncbi:MAG: hypothetical protein CMN28_05055 [Salinisphaeraceae bacterium]|nr:hypothetical protein [Salinisphaeraceae bacterium]